MNKQHTPGPWVAWRDGAVGPTSKEEDQSFGMLLPVAYVEDSDWPESADANARLIAAAPELLEALTLLVAGIENSVSKTYIPLVRANAAIAKATGSEA